MNCKCFMCAGQVAKLSSAATERGEGWADGYTDGVRYGMDRADLLASALRGVLSHFPCPKDTDSPAYKAWLWAESAYEIHKGGKGRG